MEKTFLKASYQGRQGEAWGGGGKSRTPGLSRFGGSPATQRQLRSVGEAVHAGLSVLGGLATPALSPGDGCTENRASRPSAASPLGFSALEHEFGGLYIGIFGHGPAR